MTGTVLSVSEVYDALRVRYRPPSWAFFPDIPDATGYGASRTADAVAFGLWPSQGLELLGFEVKASRGDWLRELKRPEKADKILGYCDRIFIVATTRGIIPIESLPPKWGLLEPFGGGLRATKQAETNPEARPLTKSFFASLMRQAHRYMEHAIANADVTKKAREEGLEEGERSAKFKVEMLEQKVKQLTGAIGTFEKESGVLIRDWTAGEVGRAVKIVLNGGVEGVERSLKHIRDGIDRTLNEINEKETP